MAEKLHVVVWRSVVVEEWLVEGAASADEAKSLFRTGRSRLVNRSEHDGGSILRARRATQADIDGAELQATTPGMGYTITSKGPSQ